MRSRLITLRRRSTLGRRKPEAKNNEARPSVPEAGTDAVVNSAARHDTSPAIRYSPSPKLDDPVELDNGFAAAAQGDSVDQSEAAQICRKFVGFAGSGANARALVTGLHAGSPIGLSKELSGPLSEQVSFVPPTGELRYGNVYIALAMAECLLTKAGCAAPSPQQIQAALVGGEVSKEQDGSISKSYMPGVLQLRSRGLDWRAVAQAHGLADGPDAGQNRASAASSSPAAKAAGGVGGTGALVFVAAGLTLALSLLLPAGNVVSQATAGDRQITHPATANSKQRS
jgi:hypothetical protein